MTGSDKFLLAVGVGAMGGAAALAFHFVGRNKKPSQASTSQESLGAYPSPESKEATDKFKEASKYFTALTPGELEMLQETNPKERVMFYLNDINPRGEKLYTRWMNWVRAKWGPEGFGATVPQERLKEFQDDRDTFRETFHEWFDVDTSYSKSWRSRYAKYKNPSYEQYVPGYWKNALYQMLSDTRWMKYAEAMFKKQVDQSPVYVDPDVVAKK